MQDIGFDIISDLNISSSPFVWDDKVTSPYCIIAGNISSDIKTIIQVLVHLSTLYQGVFYSPGRLEYENAESIFVRTSELYAICSNISNVCFLYHHVAVVDGIAIIGANGWASIEDRITVESILLNSARYEDTLYLNSTLTKLQRHLDVRKIIMVTNAVPHHDLYFGEKPNNIENSSPLNECLQSDTEHKVTHWVFGTYPKQADVYIDNINYVNNPLSDTGPYWPKRLTISS